MGKAIFEFLQVAIDNRGALSVDIDDSEWLRLFNFCKRQALIGIGFTAVEKLHANGVVCPIQLRMKWMALALQIEKKNALLNEQCKKLTVQYGHDGLATCILKGQGNCLNYPEELRYRRQCGDIDVWAAPLTPGGGWCNGADKDAVIEYVMVKHRLMGNSKKPLLNYHHIEAPKMEGTEVEVHFRASFLYSPFRNWKLQRWLNAHTDECMQNMTFYGFAMPTASVNVIYQLTHMYKHHIGGGLGFRHLMDYYYALRVWHNDVMECSDLQTQGMWSEGLGTSVMSSAEVSSVIRSFGMIKFTAAIMYVLREVFAMPAHYYICEPNEKEGKKLLAEIMNSGNFGHYDVEKPNVYQHRLQYHIWKFKRIFRLAMSYPEEAMWEPVFRGWRRMMKLVNDY